MAQFTCQSLKPLSAWNFRAAVRRVRELADAIEEEIRRIGGARYLPAEGGVFIGTVAELYGDGE